MAEEAEAKGNAAFAKSDYPGAIRHYSDAIALDPDNHILYSSRSAAYASLELWSYALSDAKKTARLNFQWPNSHLLVGIASIGTGRFDMALKAFEIGLSLDPNDEALKYGYEKAKAEARRKIEPLKVPEMWDDYTAWAESDPPSEEPEQKEAPLMEEKDALVTETTAIEKHLAALGLDGEAVKTTLSLGIKESDGKDSHRVEDMAGEDGDESGEQDTVELQRVRCTKQLESNPEDPQSYIKRSICCMKLGKFHEALKDADKCIELDPCLWMGYHTKGQILFHMKDYNGAGETYIVGLNLTEKNEGLMKAFGRFLQQQLDGVFTESNPAHSEFLLNAILQNPVSCNTDNGDDEMDGGSRPKDPSSQEFPSWENWKGISSEKLDTR